MLCMDIESRPDFAADGLPGVAYAIPHAGAIGLWTWKAGAPSEPQPYQEPSPGGVFRLRGWIDDSTGEGAVSVQAVAWDGAAAAMRLPSGAIVVGADASHIYVMRPIAFRG